MAPPSCVSIKAQTRLELVSMSLLDYFISAAGLLIEFVVSANWPALILGLLVGLLGIDMLMPVDD